MVIHLNTKKWHAVDEDGRSDFSIRSRPGFMEVEADVDKMYEASIALVTAEELPPQHRSEAVQIARKRYNLALINLRKHEPKYG